MRYLMILLVMFMAVGCAGVQEYSTGVPASSSHEFFFHLEEEALAQGHKVNAADDSVFIPLEEGSLQYMTYDDGDGGVRLIVRVKDAKNLSDEELATKQDQLKGVSDGLIDGARKRAESVDAFD